MDVFNKYNGRCAYCGCKLTKSNFNVDHIEPIFRNDTDEQIEKWNNGQKRGDNSIENFNPSCISCNCSKSSLRLEDWRKEIELKSDRIIRDSAQFRLLLRFGLVTENRKPIVFYFEKHNK